MVVKSRTMELISLPNEIVISILSHFSSRCLLPLSTTSKHIHSLILRIIHHRLLAASCLPDHQLIFECFHPAVRLSAPYLLCEHLGTAALSPAKPNSQAQDESAHLDLKSMRNLYTSFTLSQHVPASGSPRSHPAGGPLPFVATGQQQDTLADGQHRVSQTIHLESHELFSQLCTLTNLVKVGPKRGLFLSCVGVGEGILRVWRNWMVEQSECSGGDAGVGRPEKSAILWTDSKEHVGLRVNVRRVVDDQPVARPPAYGRADEDEAVTFVLEYEELLIRTSHLLIKVEQSIAEQMNHTGKATVIGSWER